MKGYKAFNSDLTCRRYKFEIGKTYKHEGKIKPCESGFHFCKSIAECYNFYDKLDNTRICEVEAIGEVKTDDNIKYVTDEIVIVAEVTDEWKRRGNSSATNSGFCNSGNWNSGDWNSGNWNSGNWNSGDWNSGNWNSGNRNSGNRNSGNCNSGNRNSGDWNSGNRNSGNRNSGDWNSGDWNATNYSSGWFCTEEPEMLLFDKPSGMTLREFWDTKSYRVLSSMPTEYTDTEWDDDNKVLKTIKHEADRQKWYDELSDSNKDIIKAMPNFDENKFFKCTGIRV